MKAPSQSNGVGQLKALGTPGKKDFVIGQYKDYEREVGHSTNTETYIALKILVNNWRWAEVPFILEQGKNFQ